MANFYVVGLNVIHADTSNSLIFLNESVTCDIVIEKAQHSSKHLFLVLDLTEEMQAAGLKCIAKL